MGVRESLVLDHFYITAGAEDFAALLQLQNVVKTGVAHNVTKTTDDSWEGLYLRSRPNSYLEILNTKEENALGIAFRPSDVMRVDVEKITQELPLKWNKLKRILPDGRPWFDAYSTPQSPSSSEGPFYAWIMHYQPHHRGDAVSPQAPRMIDRFISISLSMGRDHLNDVRTMSEWFPGTTELTNEKLIFTFKDQDGYPFSIAIELVDGNERCRLRELIFDVYDESLLGDFTSKQMNTFRLEREGRRLTLSR